jgi:hypothetical protein
LLEQALQESDELARAVELTIRLHGEIRELQAKEGGEHRWAGPAVGGR